MLPHHYEHEKRGLEVFQEMCQRLPLPNDWKKIAAFVISEHMRAPMFAKAGKITEFLMRLHKIGITISDFNDIIQADHKGLPPYLEQAEFLISELLKVSGKDAPPELKGEEIGEWLSAERTRKFVNLKKIYFPN